MTFEEFFRISKNDWITTRDGPYPFWWPPEPMPERKAPMYYDRDGNPMTMEEWAMAIGDLEQKAVERTTFKGSGVFVSTVWLGLEHGYIETEAGLMLPLIFETMVFNLPDDTEPQFRHPTIEEARKHHWLVVKDVEQKYGLIADQPEQQPASEPIPSDYTITYEFEEPK